MLERRPRFRRVARITALGAAAAALGAGATLGLERALDTSSAETAGTLTAPATPAGSESAGAAATGIETLPVAATSLDPSQIYEQAAPGVVEIAVTAPGDGFGPYGRSEVDATGSGFVLDTGGNIVTNAHVVSGASTITVRFLDGTEAKGTLVGSDASTDVAVVHVDVPASALTPLELGSSADVRPGEGVVAIGSPYGLEGTITAGIVSAVDRTIEAPDGAQITGVIQTDAALNGGNSGGPLLDADGKVIGVNAQIESRTGSASGVGFAVPIETASSVASRLIAGEPIEHAFLGVRVQTVSALAAEELDLPRGAQVAEVESGSPAAKAGLAAGTQTQEVGGAELTKDGDVIVAIDGTPVTTAADLAAAIAGHEPGDEVTLDVVREGNTRTADVTLVSRPS